MSRPGWVDAVIRSSCFGPSGKCTSQKVIQSANRVCFIVKPRRSLDEGYRSNTRFADWGDQQKAEKKT